MDGKMPSTTASKTKHPSLLFPRQKELNETVRQYAAALINYHHITPFEYEKDDTLKQFGDMSAKELKKVLRRKKLKKHKAEKLAISEELQASLQANSWHVDADELARRAEEAGQAMEQASKLAGECVVYCCGQLRLKDKINYECECRTRKHYRLINSI